MDGRMVKVGLIIMIDKKFLAVTVGAIFVLGMYGPNVAEIVQSAEAHGVQAVSYTHLTLPTILRV